MDRRKVSVAELEALVVEHVFEWQRFETFRDQAKTVPETLWFRPNHQYPTDCPKFARDANATRMVIDKLRGEGYRYRFWDGDDGGKAAQFQRPQELPDQAVGQYDDGVLICLAALATKGIYVEVE